MNRPLVHVVLILLVSALAYSNTLENGFHLDDVYRVQDNRGVQQFWSPFRHFTDASTSSRLPRVVQYRPLLPLSLSVNYAIAGDSLVGYHIGNILFQLLASVGLYFLARELFTHWLAAPLPPYAALFVALLFAVHPVSGVVVNYVCSRDLSMMEMFLAGSVYCYARMRRLGETKGRWALCLGLLLLSMLAKKNSVVAPALVLLFELLVARESIWKAAVWRRVGLFAGVVLLLVGYIRLFVEFDDLHNVVSGDAGQYAAAQAQHHVFHYLRNFVWPLPIRPYADDPIVAWKQVVGALVIAGSLVVALRVRSSRPIVAFGILSYWTLLVLTSSVLPFHSTIAPYRPYPASAFLFLVLGALAMRHARFGSIVLGALILYFAGMSFLMNKYWKDGMTLARHANEHGGNVLAMTQLAEKMPDGPEKEKLYLSIIERADTYVMARIGLALTQIKIGKRKEGLKLLKEVVRRAGDIAQVQYSAAQGLQLAGMPGPAADHAMLAVDRQPENLLYRAMAADFLLRVARYQDVLEVLAPVMASAPEYRWCQYYFGVSQAMLGKLDDGIRNLRAFVQRVPGHAAAWQQLGEFLAKNSDLPAAIAAMENCLRADPRFRMAHKALGDWYARVGEPQKAAEHRRAFGRMK